MESDRNDANIHWPSTAHHNSGKFPNSDGRDGVHKGCHSQWAHSGVGQEADRRRIGIGSQSHFDKEEILASMTTMHNELIKKVDLCMRNSQKELQVVPLFDSPADFGNEIFVNAEEEAKGKPVTIVPASSEKKFHFFYSNGELRRLPPKFVFPHMGLCSLIVNWFCGNPSQKTMPFKHIVPRDLHSRSLRSEH